MLLNLRRYHPFKFVLDEPPVNALGQKVAHGDLLASRHTVLTMWLNDSFAEQRRAQKAGCCIGGERLLTVGHRRNNTVLVARNVLERGPNHT